MQVLTDEWFVAVDEALGSLQIEPYRALVIGQVVTGVPAEVEPSGTLSYRLVVADGRARLRRGHEPPADVTITTPWTLALGIAEGRASAQQAFLQGELRIGGDPRLLITNADVAAEISRVTASVR